MGNRDAKMRKLKAKMGFNLAKHGLKVGIKISYIFRVSKEREP